MGVNFIITCNHTECKYCHEKQCGKSEIYLDDKECIALMSESDENGKEETE